MVTPALLLVLGCARLIHRPPTPPPQPEAVASVVRCEGADQVRRTANGAELDRWSKAPTCTIVRCERHDFVRRTNSGVEVERWSNAPQCPAPRPVKLTTNAGWKYGLTAS
jgi:hypothetical protein